MPPVSGTAFAFIAGIAIALLGILTVKPLFDTSTETAVPPIEVKQKRSDPRANANRKGRRRPPARHSSAPAASSPAPAQTFAPPPPAAPPAPVPAPQAPVSDDGGSDDGDDDSDDGADDD